MVPAAYRCEYARTLPAGAIGSDCVEPQAEGTAFCAKHLVMMRERWIAIHDREEAVKQERYMAVRREAEALDHEEAA